MKNNERLANLVLPGLTLAPLVVNVNPDLNMILTAFLTVYVGCYRSVKPTPPLETMPEKHAIRFPLYASVMMLYVFLLFEYLPQDLVNSLLMSDYFVLGIVALARTLSPAISIFLPKTWNDKPVINWRLRALKVEVKTSTIIAAIPATLFCVWYAKKRHWLANNILGPVFCIQGIENVSLGSFKTGAIVLSGLFVYDIFWVFFTPVMESVVTSFDAPIKLLFPYSDCAHSFGLLGLGDIAVPGFFVALALRFDVSRGKESQYFRSAFVGYIVGLILTMIVAKWFQAGQPAMMYIVPAVIGFLAAHCIWNGDVKPLLEFESKRSRSNKIESQTRKKTEIGFFLITYSLCSCWSLSLKEVALTRSMQSQTRKKTEIG